MREYLLRQAQKKIRALCGMPQDKVGMPLVAAFVWWGTLAASTETSINFKDLWELFLQFNRFDFDINEMQPLLHGEFSKGLQSPASLEPIRQRMKSAWKDDLLRSSSGEIKPAGANVLAILMNDPDWAGLQYDLVQNCPVFEGVSPISANLKSLQSKVPEHLKVPRLFPVKESSQNLSDVLAIPFISQWFALTYGLDVSSPTMLYDALCAASLKKPRNPLLEWATSQEWDGVIRLMEDENNPNEPTQFTSAFLERGNPQIAAANLFFRIWVLSLVARATNPGCTVHTVLVLEGEQGLRKSSSMAALLPDVRYISSSPIDLSSKEGLMMGEGKVIQELSEMDSLLTRHSAEELKQFIRDAVDRYRGPWQKKAQDFPRMFVLYGSINRSGAWLNDVGSQRAYMPVLVERPIDTDWIAKYRGQIWAEALLLLEAGVGYFPSKEEERVIIEAMEPRLLPNAIAEQIKTLLLRYGLLYCTTEEVMNLLEWKVERATSATIAKAMASLNWAHRRTTARGGRFTGWQAPLNWPRPPAGWNSEGPPQKGAMVPLSTLPSKERRLH